MGMTIIPLDNMRKKNNNFNGFVLVYAQYKQELLLKEK